VAIKPFKSVSQNNERIVVGKPVAKTADKVRTFEPGAVIFRQGDTGGDLLFIESGAIEIYVERGGQEVVLASMGKGEIVGVMTFLTKDKRLASARAAVQSSIKTISSTQIQKVIQTFPKWLIIVLREFIGRISHMNRMYSDVVVDLRKAKELQISSLFLATQMAGALGIVGRSLAKSSDPNELVAVADLSEKMQAVLNQHREMINNLVAVFIDTGILKLEGDPKLKKVATLASLDAAASFTKFIRESVQGSTKKIVKARLTETELSQIRAIAQFCIKKGQAPERQASVTGDVLMAELERSMGVFYTSGFLEKAGKAGLIALSGDQTNLKISFIPNQVLTTIGHIEAMRRLTSEEAGSSTAQFGIDSVA
jgi:CRP-like cAMP-binding protein